MDQVHTGHIFIPSFKTCNVILDGIDNIEILPNDEDEHIFRNDLEGQALAIRGLALFDLTRFFGYTYLKDNGASLGVPIITSASATATVSLHVTL